LAYASSLSSTTGADKSSRVIHEAVIEQIVEHDEDTRSLFLRLPSGQSLKFIPGQFLSLLLPIAGQTVTRAYSIASDPESENLLEICFNLVPGGRGSHYLFERRTGDVLQFTGPWGTFILDHPLQTDYVFIADGVGIVPLRSMIKRTLALGAEKSVQLLYSAIAQGSFLYGSDLRTLEQRYSQFSFTLFLLKPVEQNRPGGVLLDMVEHHYIRADKNRDRHFYICGVGNQVTTLRDLLRQGGYQRRAVQYEKW